MRLPLRTLVDALAVDHEGCVVALRWPDQEGDLDGIEPIALEAPGLVARRTCDVAHVALAPRSLVSSGA